MLVVGIVARISGCANQKEVSLDDQIDHAKEVVAELYEGPEEYRIIATKGKGERLDRPELAKIEQLLRTRELDLLVMEDLGRLVRGTEASSLCGIAVDHGTRVIAPNDCIDTSEESWEEDVISACRDHVGHNAHTSKRLKHKLLNRFKKNGGATSLEPYGYIKPKGAKTFDDWQKDPQAEAIIVEGARRLKESLNCTAVADWLNRLGVPVGKYCQRSTWSGAMVRRLYRNPLLKGQPGRGFKHTIKHHETGRRIAVPNPKGPVFLDLPHLAFLTSEAFDELNRLLSTSNAKHSRPKAKGLDPRHRVPRKRTRFPGQHACCWYCGRQYVWGGNGISGNLMCSGAREWRCWNSIGAPGELTTSQVLAAIKHELYKLDGIDAQFAQMVRLANRNDDRDLTSRYRQLEHQAAELERKKANFLAAIAKLGMVPMIESELKTIEESERALRAERRQLERRQTADLQLPANPQQLRGLLEQQLAEAAQDSDDLAQWLRRLVPEVSIYLVRSLDGGHLLSRAKVQICLGAALPDVQELPELSHLLTRELTLDLFKPPQRLRIFAETEQLAAMGLSHKEIGARIEEQPTSTAVGRALALARQMRGLGLESPLVTVLSPPDDYPKLRRHRNSKYRFEPLADYEQPEL